ncbi:uncharacterized protein LOC121384693 [Gigantopelta aegis]|uniref:uncharacterized protein LOC121384693 n=1 Tax=Gigantopelta aegis TaxID=1735272 RepID=UPI001B889682|nr:uncharacterized protein LOC121384693 [Gigantopelta aegis]
MATVDQLVFQFSSAVNIIDSNTKALHEILVAFDALARHLLNNKSEEQIKIERIDQVTVEVKCTFLKIWDIDTLTQKYNGEVFIQAKWPDPGINTRNPVYDPKYFWNPKLVIKNVAGDLTVNRKSYSVSFVEPGASFPVVIQYWMIKGIFEENLELQHFPFDVQDVTIQVSTERSTKEVRIIEDQHMMSTVNPACLDGQDWTIYRHVECFQDITTMEYASLYEHPVLFIQCRACRKVGYFVWNIIGIVLMIMLLTFGTLAIDPNIPDRMVITITLFLTLVAFKLVVKSNLPTISYLTYLDKYILASLVFLGIQTAESAVMDALTRVYTMDEVIYYDQLVMRVIATTLFLFHVIFWIYIYNTAFSKRRLMFEKDQLYLKKRVYLHKHGVLDTHHQSAEHESSFGEKTSLISK